VSPASAFAAGVAIILGLSLVVRIVRRTFDSFEAIGRPTVSPFRARARLSQQ